MEEKKLVPKLRFPGFTEPWEQCKLGNLGTLKNGMNFSKEAMGKGYPFINLQNIFGSNVIDLTKLEKAEATDSQLKDYNLQKGDVLFVRSSVKLEGVGEAALISEDLKDTTYSGFIIRFRDNYGLDYNFKRFIFTTVLIRNQIMSQATNSANKNISQSVLNNLNLLIPTKDEQSKIGLIFSKLDKCITLHQRKLEHLKLKKKSLLQKLFPKEGEVYPELRFPGFTDPWEQRKLGEVANIKTGSRNQQDSVTNGQYPFFIRSEKIEKLDTYDFDTEAILVPGDGRIGEIFHYYNGKFALHQRVYKIDDFKGIDAFYLLYLFQYRFKEHALRLNAQGTVPSLRLPMFTEWDLCIPSLQEQGCIGRFLNKIELIITLHQRKLEHLQLLKKALLQQLFV